MAWSVVLPLGTPIYTTPHLSTLQIQISLTRFRMPSVHPYHGYLDGPPSGPFWLALIFWLLAMHEDTIHPPGCPDMPAPGSTAQGSIVPSPNSSFTPVCHQSPTPSPSTFYDFTGYQLEERSFLSSLCDEIGTVSDLQTVAASLGFKFSRVEQILMSFPHDFPTAVFATLAGWYTASRSMFCEKLDDLEEAFKEMHKGTLFNRIVNAHSVVLQRVSSLPRIRQPNSDTLNESLGEVVMNTVEIIHSCHLRLLCTLLQEILSDGDLLTMAAACGITPVVTVAVTESHMRPSHKAARVFLPWFAQSDLIPKAKYLHLKFGFQCASLLPVFNNILEDYRLAVVSAMLLTVDEHLFTLTFAPSICVSAEETRQTLNEWEFTFLTILCNAIYNACKISAAVLTLQVPVMILNDAALVHGLPAEQDALTAHILFEWWCSALNDLYGETYLPPMCLHWHRSRPYLLHRIEILWPFSLPFLTGYQ